MLKETNNKSRMLQSSVTDKILEFRRALDAGEPVLYRIKEDVTLFANFFFKDPFDQDKDFVPYAWQDTAFQDTGRRICICIARQRGKTTFAILKAINYAYFHNNAVVIIVSKTFDQAKEVVEKIHVMLKASSKVSWDALRPNDKESKGEVKILNKRSKGESKTYSRIICVPATDAARGYTADMVIADEGAFWEEGDYIFKRVVMPTTQKSKGQVLLLSTPNGAQGFFYEAFQSPDWNAYQYDWRADPTETEEEMAKVRNGMTSLEFNSEHEAEFVSPKNAYFPYHMVQSAVDETAGNEMPTSSQTAIGVDFGKIHDQAVIMVGCIENPSADKKDQVIRVVKRVVKPLGTLYSSVVGEIAELAARYKVTKIVLDATGVGEAPVEFLRSEGLPVEGVKFSIQSKTAMYTPLRMLFEQKRIKIPKEKQLTEQLTTFMYEYTISGNLKLFPPDGGHDDECDALVLMTHGLLNFQTVNFSVVSAKPKSSASLKFYLQVCDTEKGGCGAYFKTHAEHHFVKGLLCGRCKGKS